MNRLQSECNDEITRSGTKLGDGVKVKKHPWVNLKKKQRGEKRRRKEADKQHKTI